MEVYLDNSATTRTFPEVAELMTKVMCEDYGNPSSLHRKGVQAEQYLRYAREVFARILKVGEKEILFTSGGTESDNLALIGCARANERRGRHLITTQVEHPAVLNTMRYLESTGYRVTYLPVSWTRIGSFFTKWLFRGATATQGPIFLWRRWMPRRACSFAR